MKNRIEKAQVEKIAKLAKLELSGTEVAKFTAQLEEVIDYNVDKLNQVDTEDVEPLLNVSGLTNSTREDSAETYLTQDEALQNTKDKHNGFFKVGQILEQD